MAGSYIVAGARTPIGKLSGALASLSAADLGGLAIKAALERAGVAPEDVEVGTRVKATLRRMKLGHEGDIYYSYKFVVDPDGAPAPV